MTADGDIFQMSSETACLLVCVVLPSDIMSPYIDQILYLVLSK